jgi:hypothetical protein
MVITDRVYEVDDEYRIVDNRNGHGIDIGDIVKVMKSELFPSITVPGEYYVHCLSDKGDVRIWSILENDMEPVIRVPKIFLDDSLFEI